MKPLTRVRRTAQRRDETREAYEQAFEAYRQACIAAMEAEHTLEEVAREGGVTRQAIWKLMR